ncbi:hypothetical protein Tsubulata_011156 [Turnera subulata]|uniref:Tim44-like domain-containing protein n=1 Tax=Turnera subulata TaxID=218843 RepID=A0A9Q0FSU7_9ROSI|nr:hypothetical protein Tsubulata_011156 [Turnera subulata]
MASRKLVRDLFLSSRQPLYLQLASQQGISNARLRLLSANGYLGYRRFSVFNEFSKKLKGEVDRNQEFQKTVKELKEKAEELKVVKEDLKVRTKQTTEQLYKHVDGVWTEAEATAKKVSANVKEKISAATEEVKGSFRMGKEEPAESSGTSAKDGVGKEDSGKTSSGEETAKQNQSTGTEETLFGKFKSSIPSSKFSVAFQRLKDAKVTDVMKKGYDAVKDELYGNPNRRKHLEYTPPPPFKGEISTKTDLVVLPSKQSPWSKKWEAFKLKMQSHPMFKRFSDIGEPVVTKSQEIAEDMREKWETSDNPIVHKIQDVGETIFQETDAAATQKEIHRRDPSFSLVDFVAEVQEAVRPVLTGYMKGDIETLKKYCSDDVIKRCEAERRVYQSHGIFFDHKILHISEVEVTDTKMLGTSPLILVSFRTQQVHCVRDQHGQITEGSQDTILTVFHAWAMEQVDPQELGEGAIYPIWKIKEIHQEGVQALI